MGDFFAIAVCMGIFTVIVFNHPLADAPGCPQAVGGNGAVATANV